MFKLLGSYENQLGKRNEESLAPCNFLETQCVEYVCCYVVVLIAHDAFRSALRKTGEETEEGWLGTVDCVSRVDC